MGGSGGPRLVLAFHADRRAFVDVDLEFRNDAGAHTRWRSPSPRGPTTSASLCRCCWGLPTPPSVGGVGTLIGTPPNPIFAGAYEEATGEEYGFTRWMKTGLPGALIAVPIMAWWLARKVKTSSPVRLPDPGAWRKAEQRAVLVFGIAILAWIFRREPAGGWSGLVGAEGAGDSTVALAAVILMFLIPNGERTADGRPDRLLDWKTANEIPWGMLLLFAGGICLAKGWGASGLSDLAGQGACGCGEPAAFPDDPRDLPVGDLPHRDHLKYRDGDAPHADAGCGGAGHWR